MSNLVEVVMSTNMAYDVIGDIHGQAGKLQQLLGRLGYERRGRLWVPPQGRMTVFLGDLIDRGPQQLEVLDTVRRMMDAGHARCVMGNHEFNAIGYVTLREDGAGHLRAHTPKNLDQHRAFLAQVGEGSARHHEWVQWFRGLPPTLDLGGIRVVHAWWHRPWVEAVADALGEGRVMDDAFLHAAYREGSLEWQAMEGLTKGLEIPLPAGYSFTDHGGVERFHVRARWWLESPGSYRDVAIVSKDQRESMPELPLPPDYVGAPAQGSPVFVGHYWMEGTPHLVSPTVACVDWSAAKDGPLVAYRWEGESQLDAARFVCSDA